VTVAIGGFFVRETRDHKIDADVHAPPTPV
jgi:hypothetical protein